MESLYPNIEPYNTGFMEADQLHKIHFEECGNPDGKPVLFIHGGPGGAVTPMYRRYFNPEIYRIVLVDQRACGKSTPHATLEANTTNELIADFEKLRAHLQINKWQLFGGSWGSTLALAYAEKHPEVVSELVLRGIFLGTRKEAEWIFEDNGAAKIYPDAFEDYVSVIPEGKRDQIIDTYYELLNSTDPAVHGPAALAWSRWEFSVAKLYQDPDLIEAVSDPKYSLAIARIECHYLRSGCFFTENQLLNNIDKISHIPMTIVQGRYDVICPVESAWKLHHACPNSALIIVQDAGHSSTEPGIVKALVGAADQYAQNI